MKSWSCLNFSYVWFITVSCWGAEWPQVGLWTHRPRTKHGITDIFVKSHFSSQWSHLPDRSNGSRRECWGVGEHRGECWSPSLFCLFLGIDVCQMFFLLQKCWLFWDSWLCLFDKPKNCLKRKICSPQILPPNYSTGRWFCCKTWQSLSIIVIIIIIIIHPRRENAEYKISHPHQPEYLTNNLYDLVLRNSPGCSKLLALRSCNDLNKLHNLHTA